MSRTSTERASVTSQSGPLTSRVMMIQRTTERYAGHADARLPKGESLNAHHQSLILREIQERKAIDDSILLHAEWSKTFTVNDIRADVERNRGVTIHNIHLYGSCFARAQDKGIIKAIPNHFTDSPQFDQSNCPSGCGRKRGVTVWGGVR